MIEFLQRFLVLTLKVDYFAANLSPGMELVDFTNPQACKWYQDKLEVLLDMGVDCFKIDFTGIKYYDGSDPVKMHNYYTYLYNKTVFELMEKKRGRDQAMVFARSATAGGQKFLVAPVFSQTGMVSYYLPKGIWTNYLTGEKREGEKWHKEKFDYFNLPLLVRENTILAVGNNTEDVEYDYTENLTLRIYEIGDGRETSIKVADKAGKEKVYAEASRKGQVITIKVEGATNWRAEYFGVEDLEIIKS